MTNEMGVRLWLATEGGRKCPLCGRYAKSSELGNLSFSSGGMHISLYGHIDGTGCRETQVSENTPCDEEQADDDEWIAVDLGAYIEKS